MNGLRNGLLLGVSSFALVFGGDRASAQEAAGSSPDNNIRVIQGGDPARPTGTLTADAAENADTDQDIVVTGVKEALRSAQAIKRNANQIVDSVQAQDIGRLPDANTTEALQRITGVQIQRRYGEGATDFDHRTQPAITVRGLTQTINLIDGRAAFSAAGSRALDLEGIPPELLAGIDVFKNPPASIVEGGIGGAVNLRTRLPFDSAARVISATVKGNYYDRADQFGGSASALYSSRFETGAGEMGLLVNAVYGRAEYAQHGIIAGEQVAPLPGTVAGLPANGRVPLGFQIYDDNGNRTRLGVAGAFQWQAAHNVLLTAQAQYARYTFDRLGTYVYANNRYETRNGVLIPTPAAGAPFTFNDEGYATSGAIGGQLFESGRFDQALWSNTGNYTVKVAWDVAPNLRAVFDAQYLKSVYNADRNGLVLSQLSRTFEEGRNSPNAQTVNFDLRGKRPVWNVSNPARLMDAASYSIPFIADSRTRNDADQLALAYDLEYDVEGGFLQKLRGGLRYSDSSTTLRGTWNGVCLYADRAENGGCDKPGLSFPRLSNFPQLFMGGPSTPDFFDGRTLPGGVLYPEFLPGRDLWDRLGQTYALVGAQRKLNFDPADITQVDEKTLGVYGALDYAVEVGSVRIDGNAGVRLVRTDLASTGTQFIGGVPAGQLVTEKRYLSALPSVNVRARLTDTFQVRGAFSKAITRPNFDQLSTNLTLGAANQINPITGRPSASQGNPNLDPIKSDNYDVTAEWYFSPTGSVTGGLFYKDVSNFIFSDAVVRVYNGQAYDTATSINSGRGTVKGFELAYQQFFDFLPGPLSGLGVQANYTYAYSSADRTITNLVTGATRQEDVSLEKLSRHSYNLVGLYEKGPVTARLAWNWRGRYLDTTTGSGANGRFQFQEPYATLDASINYNLNAHLAVGIDAVNLNNRMGITYIDTPGQPLQYTLNDRRFGLTLRATY